MPQDTANVNHDEMLFLEKHRVLIEVKSRRDWVKLCCAAKGHYFVMWGDWQGGDIWKWCEFPCNSESEADKTFNRYAAQALKYKHSAGKCTLEDVLLYEALHGNGRE